jgi:hypothetical protein
VTGTITARKISGRAFSQKPIHRLLVMVDTFPSKRKKPVNQKRVAVVLASLVGMMTVFAALLLILENSTLGTAMPGYALTPPDISAAVDLGKLRMQGWNFIIIYESGDLAARADSLADGRLAGGSSPTTVRPKANFHFVIDSAHSGTLDGYPETGTSWKKQELGAYAGWLDSRYHSLSLYSDAVGICLAAELNHDPISDAQHQTLLHLVKELQARCRIPAEHVLFQWEMDPQRTATPAQQACAQRLRAAL